MATAQDEVDALVAARGSAGATRGEVVRALPTRAATAAWDLLVGSGRLVHTGAHRQVDDRIERVYAIATRYDPNEPRDPHGRWTTGVGVAAMGELSEPLQGKIKAKMESLTGMSEAELARRAQDNLVALYRKGNPTRGDWYAVEGADLQRRAAKYGISQERFTGMVAVTSAQKRWLENKDFAESIARKLHDDAPFTLSRATLDDYNTWAAKRRGSDIAPHLGIRPGTYRPSQLPSDLVTSVTPGMPRHLNTSFVVSAVRIYRGEQSVDQAVLGPKQRSFVNNLMDPQDARYVTVDTWHYRATMGDIPITAPVKGKTYSYTLAQWDDRTLARQDGRAAAYGYDPAKPIGEKKNLAATIKATRQPQDFFQSGPSAKAENYTGNYGTYPWFVAQTQAAAETLGVTPNALQAVAWYGVGGGV